MSLEFFVDIKSFRSHYDPGVELASNRNDYQEHFLGGEVGLYVRLTTLSPSCAAVMKSGNLKFLEPSGPLQACDGAALPLYIYIYIFIYVYVYIRRNYSETYVKPSMTLT